MAALDDIVCKFPDASWDVPRTERASTAHLAHLLEGGQVPCLPRLAFALSEEEQRFPTLTISDGRAKNISLRDMIQRFSQQAQGVVDRLFPRDHATLRAGDT